MYAEPQSVLHRGRLQFHNGLLDAVCDDARQHLARHMRQIKLDVGDVLYDAGVQSRYLYFPESGTVSLSCELQDGSSTQVAVVGSEGVVGIFALIGGDHSTCRAVVQAAGHAYRIPVDFLKADFDKGERMQQLLLQYLLALIAQISQTVACNRHHRVEQQICRWVLLNLDRSTTGDLVTTHEIIARNLGVRRESVTEAVNKLRAEQVIESRRGLISVRDRRPLERRVCECYWVVQRACDDLLPSNDNDAPWLVAE